MAPIRIRICLGTTCFVMGASNLQALAEQLPPELQDKVEIEGVTCLGLCKDRKFGRAPYVCIGDEILPAATLAGIVQKLKTMVDITG